MSLLLRADLQGAGNHSCLGSAVGTGLPAGAGDEAPCCQDRGVRSVPKPIPQVLDFTWMGISSAPRALCAAPEFVSLVTLRTRLETAACIGWSCSCPQPAHRDTGVSSFLTMRWWTTSFSTCAHGESQQVSAETRAALKSNDRHCRNRLLGIRGRGKSWRAAFTL